MFCLNLFFFKSINFRAHTKNINYNIFKKTTLIANEFSIIKKGNIINKKYLNFLFKFKNNYYFKTNYLNIKEKSYFFNSINFFIKNNFNFLILSSENKLLLPYYLNIFKESDIFRYKNFIFYNSIFVNFNNWLFFFKAFLKKFNIKVIFFPSLVDISKFLKIYDKIDIIKIGVVSETVLNVNFDYFFFINNSDKYFYNIFLLNYFIKMFFNNLNNNFNDFKIISYISLKKIILKMELLKI